MESRYSIIHSDALVHNFNQVKGKVGSRLAIMPIVKANAYGHGLIECARIFQQAGADYLGVALIEEAVQLRAAGITIPILVLGAIVAEQIPLFLKYDIDIMAASVEKLKQINQCAQTHAIKARVHLKIDTGLGRIGVRYSNADAFFFAASELPWIDVVGVASHLATSDNQDTHFMYEQIDRFQRATEFFTRHNLPMPIRHIANSGAIMQAPESYFDMVRPGIMLYGVYPSSWMKTLCDLKLAMAVHARVVYFKVALEHSGVSYGLTWYAKKNTRIITIPIGYGDGYPRALSHKGSVLINGARYPIVGTICMDQMMIDIGAVSVHNGDEVVLIGASGEEEITMNDLADLYGGSPYELLVGLNNRIARRYLWHTSEKNIQVSGAAQELDYLHKKMIKLSSE